MLYISNCLFAPLTLYVPYFYVFVLCTMCNYVVSMRTIVLDIINQYQSELPCALLFNWTSLLHPGTWTWIGLQVSQIINYLLEISQVWFFRIQPSQTRRSQSREARATIITKQISSPHDYSRQNRKFCKNEFTLEPKF